MLKLYEGQKHSTYEIQNYLGVSKNTLYKYARGDSKVEKMSSEMLYKMAKFEGIPMKSLYEKMQKYQKN